MRGRVRLYPFHLDRPAAMIRVKSDEDQPGIFSHLLYTHHTNEQRNCSHTGIDRFPQPSICRSTFIGQGRTIPRRIHA
jgi:hypothetical protein